MHSNFYKKILRENIFSIFKLEYGARGNRGLELIGADRLMLFLLKGSERSLCRELSNLVGCIDGVAMSERALIHL